MIVYADEMLWLWGRRLEQKEHHNFGSYQFEFEFKYIHKFITKNRNLVE